MLARDERGEQGQEEEGRQGRQEEPQEEQEQQSRWWLRRVSGEAARELLEAVFSLLAFCLTRRKERKKRKKKRKKHNTHTLSTHTHTERERERERERGEERERRRDVPVVESRLSPLVGGFNSLAGVVDDGGFIFPSGGGLGASREGGGMAGLGELDLTSPSVESGISLSLSLSLSLSFSLSLLSLSFFLSSFS